jgi:hypothetical protein
MRICAHSGSIFPARAKATWIVGTREIFCRHAVRRTSKTCSDGYARCSRSPLPDFPSRPHGSQVIQTLPINKMPLPQFYFLDQVEPTFVDDAMRSLSGLANRVAIYATTFLASAGVFSTGPTPVAAQTSYLIGLGKSRIRGEQSLGVHQALRKDWKCGCESGWLASSRLLQTNGHERRWNCLNLVLALAARFRLGCSSRRVHRKISGGRVRSACGVQRGDCDAQPKRSDCSGRRVWEQAFPDRVVRAEL